MSVYYMSKKTHFLKIVKKQEDLLAVKWLNQIVFI